MDVLNRESLGTMDACVLHGIGDLRFEQVPVPTPEPGEVLLKVRAAGICGSDIPRVFTKGTYYFPAIPGHEFAGEVIAAGPGCEDMPGGRFAVYPLIPCGSCAACQDGQYQLCSDYDYYGSRRDGAFASYLAVKKWNLIPLPEGVSFEAAALCEPCAVAIHALRQGGLLTSGTGDRADGMPGDRGKKVAIFGAGTIGILAAMIAESHQISAVLFDVDQRKLDFAASLGFSHCVNSREAAPDQTFRRIHGGGADVVLDAAGVSSAVEDALLTAKTGGCVVLMGNPAGDIHIGQKKYWEILRKQLTLRGTWNSSFDPQRSDRMRNDWTCALDLMRPAGGKRTPADAGDARLYNVEKLITHRFAFSACEEAFRLAADPGQFSVKVMFENE